MKRLIIVFLLMLSMTCFSQQVRIVGSKLEVRNDDGVVMVTQEYKDMIVARGGSGVIAILYEDGKVEIRDSQLNLKCSNYFSSVEDLILSNGPCGSTRKTDDCPCIYLYYKDRMEKRNKNLNLITTQYY